MPLDRLLPRAGIFIIGLSILLTVEVQASDLGKSKAPPDTEKKPSPLQVSLLTDQLVYLPGEAVHLTLTLTNTSNADITLSFRSSHQTDFVIQRDEHEIWRWSEGRMFAQALTVMKIKPKGRRKIDVIWDQKDLQGREVPVNSYEAVGLLLAERQPYRAVASFKIVAPIVSENAPTQ